MAARLPMARFRMSSMPDDWLMALLRASCQETVSMCHPSAGSTTRVPHDTSSAGQAGTTVGLTIQAAMPRLLTSAAEVGETHGQRGCSSASAHAQGAKPQAGRQRHGELTRSLFVRRGGPAQGLKMWLWWPSALSAWLRGAVQKREQPGGVCTRAHAW